jgi:RNA polymerase sigma-70 factor (ECF subfamily)
LLDAGKFRPWAFRIARDRIYREYRRRKVPLQPIDENVELPAVEEPDTTADLEELQHCLNALSPEHREVLLLRFFEDMSYEDIARLTGSSVGTIRSRIHYGKRALKAAWKGTTP